MKVDTGGMTDFLTLPIEETEAIITAIKKAEKAGDLAALQWCARRLIWLYDEASGVTEYDDHNYPAHLFNKAWAKELDTDPPPESAIIINQPEETLTAPAYYKNSTLELDFIGVDIQINNRSQAQALLNDLIIADGITGETVALKALKSAIEQSLI